MNKGTGLVVLEVRNSNPNGNPDRDGEPRTTLNDYGEISSVSFKRKMRDLILQKDGPVWKELENTIISKTDKDASCYDILESRGRDRKKIADMSFEEVTSKFWDVRVFGCTFLEKTKTEDNKEKKEKSVSHIATGPLQIGMGRSISPVQIDRRTLSNKSGVENDKDRGLAPEACKTVEHAVYCIPFHFNPTIAKNSNCSEMDVEIALKTMAFSYSNTASAARPEIYIKHVWYIEHKGPLGSCRPEEIIDTLRPVKKENPDEPSLVIDEYDIPTDLPDSIKEKIASIKDYV